MDSGCLQDAPIAYTVSVGNPMTPLFKIMFAAFRRSDERRDDKRVHGASGDSDMVDFSFVEVCEI